MRLMYELLHKGRKPSEEKAAELAIDRDKLDNFINEQKAMDNLSKVVGSRFTAIGSLPYAKLLGAISVEDLFKADEEYSGDRNGITGSGRTTSRA